MNDAVREVARLAKSAGGRALLVGGCVRDSILGGAHAPKDFDIEVYGLSPDRLRDVLSTKFQLDLVGASFGVFKLKGHDIDVALPRRETKLGLGHRAFEMEHDPSLTLEEASARRDFTVNAIYEDPLTGEMLDPWNGRKDLEAGVLRHVSPHFSEDPLRVLRGMQFIARFGLSPAPETIEMCRGMTQENLAHERLMGEWSKLLLQGAKISSGLEFLRAVGWLRFYPELERLVGCEQDPEWHPEGDVWNHTLACLDSYAAARRAGGQDELTIALAVLCHDFGKPYCTKFDPVKKRIRSLGHDEAGVEPTLSFLRRLTAEERLLRDVPPLVRLHMRPFAMWRDKSSDGAVRRLATQVVSIDALVRVAAADSTLPEACDWLLAQARRLEVEASAPKPIVKGRDLIAMGMKPGAGFGPILKKAYDAQLEGAFSDLDGGLEFVRANMAPPVRYVLWDWNGTLLDDTQAALDTLNIMLRRRGNPEIGMEFYRDHFRFPVKPFYKKIGVCLENEDWDALAREYHDIYAMQPKALNGETFEALRFLKEKGVGQSIISALRQDLLEGITQELGVAGYMDYLYGVDNLDGLSKLDRGRELLRRLTESGKAAADEIILIGDSLHDKEVADALGVRCILCAQGSHSYWRLAEVAPTGRTLMESVRLAMGRSALQPQSKTAILSSRS